MDIKILDSWLRDHIKTEAGYKDIAKYLTLCGPSIEKTESVKIKGKADYVYNVEVTTNRVDMMSVRGIAREASVILPEFGFKSELLDQVTDLGNQFVESEKITLKTDPQLVNRLMGVVLEIGDSFNTPEWMKSRLESSGLRSLNPLVDITNYIMTELGQPTHVFDFDLVKPYISVRESKRGEKITSFDGKTYTLPGGDIVFENENGEIIDLPGIIGTKNSVVNDTTKRILFFIDNNDPVRIRTTSMTLGIRTVAATLNEKSVDPELAESALKRGIYLYKKLCGAKQISKIYDVYSNKPKIKSINVSHEFIEKILGTKIESKKVLRILNNLEITTKILPRAHNPQLTTYSCTPPTFRAKDITIPEDIVEEIARIYGYHNLPSKLMTGEIPGANYDSPFEFENILRNILASLGGNEVYTLSLISKEMSENRPLKLKNPLGSETEYLRTSLKNSLIAAVNENKGIPDKFHLFEIANVYIPKKGSLPTETVTLAGIFSGYSYRKAKGCIETLLERLNINVNFEKSNQEYYMESKSVNIVNQKKILGEFGVLSGQDKELIYYEFSVESLRKFHKQYPKFHSLPSYPAQIEDITLSFPQRTAIGKVLDEIKSTHEYVVDAQLVDIYEDNFTFRIWYQSQHKTLTNSEIESIRKSILHKLLKKYGGSVK